MILCTFFSLKNIFLLEYRMSNRTDKDKINGQYSFFNRKLILEEQILILEDLQNLECRWAERSKFYPRNRFFFFLFDRYEKIIAESRL